MVIMNNVEIRKIIARLYQAGIIISQKQGNLTTKAKPGAFTPELTALIKDNKPQLLDYLINESAASIVEQQDIIKPLEKRSGHLAVSFAQQRLWFIDKLHQGSAQYNMPNALTIEGVFDPDAAEQAICRIIKRHEPLRSYFIEVDGIPLQVIRERFEFTLTRHDLSRQTEQNQQQQVTTLLKLDAAKTFDLSKDLMVRATYIQLSSMAQKPRAVLLFNMHHIASDGWSMGILMREFVTQYQLVLGGKPDTTEPLSIQYADYARWQREWLEGQVLDSQLSYWKRQLEDVPAVHGLILDHARPAVKANSAGVVSGRLPLDISVGLQQIAKDNNLTQFMLLHGVLALVLSRHSASHDIVIGTPVANRTRAELEPLIGFFVNTMVLRVNTEHSNLKEYFDHIKQINLAAQSNQDVPFEQLVDLCNIVRTTQHSPLFQILLSMNTNESNDANDVKLTDLSFSGFGDGQLVSKFDLDISAAFTDDGVKFHWVYDDTLFEHERISVLNGHLETLLRAMVDKPKAKLAELSMLPPQEVDRLVYQLNNHRVDYQNAPMVHELITAHALRSPDSIALICKSEQYSYRELNEAANQLAHLLIKQGVKSNVFVGLLLERSFDMVVALLAVLKSGGAFVSLDINIPSTRMALIIEEAELNTLLIHSSLLSTLDWPTSVNVTVLDTPDCVEQLRKSPKDNPSGVGGPNLDSLAYSIFTSGSTGVPKGVLTHHRAFASFVPSMIQTTGDVFGPHCCVLALNTLMFDIVMVDFFLPLASGGKVIMAVKDDIGDPDALNRLMHNHDVNVMAAAPALWQMMANANWPGKKDLVVISGGEALSASLSRYLFDRTDRIWNIYGPTETTVCTLCKLISDEDINNQQITLGRGMPACSHLVLDENQQLLPFGAIGELYIGGDSVSRGYLNKDQLTAQSFVQLDLGNDSKSNYYRTGDFVRYLNNGDLLFVCRKDEQVKIRGYRIELEEIQHQLEQQESIEHAVVMTQNSKIGDKKLVTYLLLSPQMLNNDSGNRDNQWLKRWAEHNSNTSRWHCCYRDQSMPWVEIEEWVEATVDTIISLKPKRVLEIGFDNGMLLRGYADICERVCAVDISAEAVQQVNKDIEQKGWQHVSLKRADGLDISDFGESFDTIILNSVTQYFPSFNDLTEMLKQLLANLSDNGKIILANVGNVDMLDAFCVSKIITQASENDDIQDVRQNALMDALRQHELLISPTCLTNLTASDPAIGQVDILVNAGENDNQMMRYHYDAVLYKTPTGTAVVKDWQNWQSREHLNQLLENGQGDYFGLSGFANQRISGDILAAAKLTNERSVQLAELKSLISMKKCDDINQLNALSNQYGYQMRATWSQDERDLLDLIFIKDDVAESPEIRACSAYGQQYLTNHPQLEMIEDEFIEQLKIKLEQRLPRYMLPDGYLLMDKFPSMVSGKLDRSALPKVKTADAGEYVAPCSELQTKLQTIWQQLLEEPQVSVESDFFALGGHSLLVIRLLNDIRQQLMIELAVKDLFTYSTIKSLSAHIEALAESGNMRQVLPPIEAQSRSENGGIMPMSFAQQRLWFIDQMQGGSAQYNIPMAMRIDGHFDVDAAEQALIRVIQRHEPLRTVFRQGDENEGAVQVIAENFDFNIQRIDLSNLSVDEQQRKANRLISEDGGKPFDLSADLMVRAGFVTFSPKDDQQSGVLFFNMHHIASDGWSTGILIEEFVTHYQAVVKGEADTLPPLEIQYADYAYWQKQWLEQQVLASQINYWQQVLADVPPVHALRLAFARPKIKQHQGERIMSHLDGELTAKWQKVAGEHQLTDFMFLHGVLALLIARHSNSQDIVIGTPVANRTQASLEPLIGFFINTLALRTDTNHQLLRDYFAHIRQVNLNAQSNQDVPFDHLVELCRVPRSIAYTPLVQVMFSMNTNQSSDRTLPDLHFSTFGEDALISKFDLDIDVNITEQGTHLSWVYDRSIFSSPQIAKLSEDFSRLLGSIAANVSPQLALLPMLPDEEVDCLIHQLNDNQRDYQCDQLVHQRFEQQVNQVPNNIALICDSSQVTYQQLNRVANQIAHYLIEDDVCHGSIVGICVERSFEMMAAILGVLKVGAAYVPLAPNLPANRAQYILEDGAVEIVLTTISLSTVLPVSGVDIVMLDDCFDANNSSFGDYSEQNPDCSHLCASHLAYVLYTSGSTGKPKGVKVSHHQLNHYLEHCRDQYFSHDLQGAVVSTPLSFDASITSIVAPLIVGKQVVLLGESQDDQFAGLQHYLFAEQGRWLFKITPAHLHALSDFATDQQGCDTAHVVVLGGEQLNGEHLMVWKQSLTPNTLFVNEYGPTETVVGCCVYEVNGVEDINPSAAIPIGRPIANTHLYVLGADMTVQPTGSVGELYIGGNGVTDGYLNRDELNAKYFIDDPFKPGERLYRSGDLVRWLIDDEGKPTQLEFIGRVDEQVKIRGFRIELGEIEALLLAHQAVEAAVVVVLGEKGAEHLVAYVVADVENSTLADTLRQSLSQSLPEYMLPSVIMVLQALPLTANGKVDKSALQAPNYQSQQQYVPAETDTQLQVAKMWQQVLKLEQISINANFFALGGHSLLATRVISAIKESMAVELKIQDLFEYQTISLLSEYVDTLLRQKGLKDDIALDLSDDDEQELIEI